MTGIFAVEWTLERIRDGLPAAAAFGLLGILLLVFGFKMFEWITPKLDIEKQLQEGNMAVGIAVAALLIAIGIIVAVCVGG